MSLDDNIRKIKPYVPGEQPKDRDIIKLNTNECPYPPSPAVSAALESLVPADFRLYPDTDATELTDALSKVYGLPPEQIFTGVGSDEVLALSFLTFFTNGRPLLFPDISYSFYPVWAELYNIPAVPVPTDEGFGISAADYIGRDIGGVIIPNPNAPSGLYAPVEMFDEIAGKNPDVVVIVDEAYIDFGGESCLRLLEKHENLVIVQTCSKSRAMAGMRVGFAFGSKKLIDALKAVKFSFNSYTMNYAAIKLGAAAVRDEEYWKETCGKIIATRERLSKELKELGFTFPESRTNFVFAKHERFSGDEIFNALKSRKILVRHWNQPRIKDHLRITVGTDGEADALIVALKEITGGGRREC